MRFLHLFSVVVIGLILCLSSVGWAQRPAMEEELVYRQRFFDGKGYGGKGHPDGFTPKSEDIIYLIGRA